MYVILHSETDIWTIGFYHGEYNDEWYAHRDCYSLEEAEEYCSWLNGGSPPSNHENIRKESLASLFEELEKKLEKISKNARL
jgi:hypothetical protein